MSHLKPEVPATEKPLTEHPWTRRIKGIHSNKMKYAHNSITNPIFPKQKVPPDLKRTKFTIIGDRITKEFIFCVHLVQGLHKYKKKIFEAPIIRGVTTVEWPSQWNDLKLKYGGLAFCLTSQVAVLINDNFLGGEKELKELVESKFSYNFCLDYYKESVAAFADFIQNSGRPCAYMNIAINKKHIGTLIFMLYADILPYTCENFLRLCQQTKGGYHGTPIHRIVKDGWIQGGGFGLKETDLNCENFIIPHDRRGVLGMANAGRHTECSTQFYVLLQPAQWMNYKFVAFGQLIEGKKTLEKIEAVPTWYESPTSEIIIYQSGIFNMDCHDFTINKNTNEYIDAHIEDLNALGELLYETLLETVFLTAQLRELERLKEQDGEGGEYESETAAGLRETQRFNRKKEDIEKQLEKSKAADSQPGAANRDQGSIGYLTKSGKSSRGPTNPENNDFDVETYDPEFENEETDYQHQSLGTTPTLIVKPMKPFYMPLTDVKYPGEKDSIFDLKRFLQGDYCLESDLLRARHSKPQKEKISYGSVKFSYENISETQSENSLDSDEENEIKQYLKDNVDRVSFAGDVIRSIAKGAAKLNIFDGLQKSELLADEELRKMRLASSDIKQRDLHDKKVSISVDKNAEKKEQHTKIKRRQTGFIRTTDLEKSEIYQRMSKDIGNDGDDSSQDDDDEDEGTFRKVRIAETDVEKNVHTIPRRQTSFARRTGGEDDHSVRQSVLVRLFDDVRGNEEPPTLKDYRPFTETHAKNLLLTSSPNYPIKSDDSNKERYVRHSIAFEDISYDDVLNLQHGKRVTRKISSDYVNTIDQIENQTEKYSIRSVEYAKTRPAMSVNDYQMKNKKYHTQLKDGEKPQKRGLRLPGDSPLYSTTEIFARSMKH